MRKITMEEFIEEIKDSINSKEVVIYHICDNPFCVWKDKRVEEYELLNIPEKNKYDTIFEKLCQSLCSNQKPVFWNYKENISCSADVIINSTAIIKFDYRLLEGQNWLYQHCKNR